MQNVPGNGALLKKTARNLLFRPPALSLPNWGWRGSSGKLSVFVDGIKRLEEATDVPFVDQKKQKHFLENHKGISRLPYGLHHIRIDAVGKPIAVLGISTYYSRSNRAFERRLTGQAAGGDKIIFSSLFKAQPMAIYHRTGLNVQLKKSLRAKSLFQVVEPKLTKSLESDFASGVLVPPESN